MLLLKVTHFSGGKYVVLIEIIVFAKDEILKEVTLHIIFTKIDINILLVINLGPIINNFLRKFLLL